jgi:hypothetical protein
MMIHLLWLSLAIPIIIHLVHRRKAKPMPFSTLRFLQMVDQRVARRQRLRELLLLALRILLLAALIGAIEKPMLHTGSGGGSTVPTTVAILLDDTASMQAVEQGSSAFSRARDAALQALDGLKNEDAAALILATSAGNPPEPPTTALPELRAKLSRMKCGYGTAELSAPLRRAIGSLALSSNPLKEIYILTDMQQNGWNDALKDVAAQVPKGVPVFVVDAGADVSENLAVQEVDFGVKANVVGAPATCWCRIRNAGARRMERKVSLFIEGQKVAEQPTAVNAGGTQTLTFRHVFDRAGDFGGWVEVEPDELPADNRRYFTAQVVEKLPVLVIDGAPSPIAYRDGAFFLRLALEGSAVAGKKHSPIEARVVSDAEATALRFEDYRCIILADLPRVEEKLAGRLKDYVKAGGGLLIFCGEKADAAAFNAALATPDLAGGGVLLPAPLGPVMTASDKEHPFFRIQRTDASHPIFRDISAETDLGTARVSSFLSTEMPKEGGAASSSKSGASVIVEMDGGPLLLERKFGAGAVVLCTSSCTPAWNNLPLKPYFVPVLHQIVFYLSRTGGAAESTPVGTPYLLKLPSTPAPVTVEFSLLNTVESGRLGNSAIGPATNPNLPVSQSPDLPSVLCQVKSAPAAGENLAALRETSRPGIYRAEFNMTNASGGQAGTAQRQLFAVNTPSEETELSRLPLEKARDYLGGANVVLVPGAEAVASAVRIERNGVPLWDYLLLATIGLAVCECFVGNVLLKR